MSGLHLNTSSRASDVRAFAEQVEAIGASLSDFPLQVAGRYYHVWLGALSGDYRETERLCRTLMDSLPGDLSRERFGLVAYPAVVSRAFLARALAELGVFDEGRGPGHEAVRLAEALDHPFSLIWACLNLGHLEGLRGEFIRATMPLERAAALSREWNIAYLIPIALAALGNIYAAGGTRRGRRVLAAASPGRLCIRRDRIPALDEHGAARQGVPPRGPSGGGAGLRCPCRGARPRARENAVTRLGPTTSSASQLHITTARTWRRPKPTTPPAPPWPWSSACARSSLTAD